MNKKSFWLYVVIMAMAVIAVVLPGIAVVLHRVPLHRAELLRPHQRFVARERRH